MSKGNDRRDAEWAEIDDRPFTFPRVIYPICYMCGKLTAEWWGFFSEDGVAMALCRRCIEEKPS